MNPSKFLTILIPVLLFLFPGKFLQAQYSPFYHHQEHIDQGLTSEEHAAFINKVVFTTYNNRDEDRCKFGDFETVLEGSPRAGMRMHVYLDHSLKYYFDQEREKGSPGDWDYKNWKGNYPVTASQPNRYVSGLLMVLTVDGKEFKAWKHSVFESHFETYTSWTFTFWRWGAKYMGYDEYCFPLFQWLRKNKKSDPIEVKVDVYLAHLDCQTPADRGPLLASGSFKMSFEEESFTEIMSVPDNSHYVDLGDYTTAGKLFGPSKK